MSTCFHVQDDIFCGMVTATWNCAANPKDVSLTLLLTPLSHDYSTVSNTCINKCNHSLTFCLFRECQVLTVFPPKGSKEASEKELPMLPHGTWVNFPAWAACM